MPKADDSKKIIEKYVTRLNGSGYTIVEDGFAEITIPDDQFSGHTQGQKIPRLDPAADRIREIFTTMRELGRDLQMSGSYERHQAALFVKQAKMMADFVDNYDALAPFQSYYPDYQCMGIKQLRTYFTWRTKVRNGIVGRVSNSYAFLYTYELINLIGVENPQDGLRKLLDFWAAYREYEPKIDQYLSIWARDFWILYIGAADPKASFDEVLLESPLLQKYYKPTGTADRYDRYAPLSTYQFTTSSFYSPENEDSIRGCFQAVYLAINRFLAPLGGGFDDLIFYEDQSSRWIPFARALYLPEPAKLKEGLTVWLSEDEYYCYHGAFWTTSFNRVCKDAGKQFLTYLLRRIEQFYRAAQKFKYKLGVSSQKLQGLTVGNKSVALEGLLACIETAMTEHFQEATKISITVDQEKLRQIREAARLTQERLLAIQPDAESEDFEQVVPSVSVEIFEQAPPSPPEPSPPPLPEPPPVSSPADLWVQLAESFTEWETAALRLALAGASLRALQQVADDGGLMLEVLIDGINEKAQAAMSDNLLELNDSAEIYDEYRIEIERVIGLEPQ